MVTPPARYKPYETLTELRVDARTGRVIEVLVHHHHAGHHAFSRQIDDRGSLWHFDSGYVAHFRDVSVAKDQRLVRFRRRTCAVDDPNVRQRDDRSVDRDEAANGVAELRTLRRQRDANRQTDRGGNSQAACRETFSLHCLNELKAAAVDGGRDKPVDSISSRRCVCERKADIETCTAVGAIPGRHGAAVSLDDRAGDGEAEPGVLAAARRLGPIREEPLEHPIDMGRRDAGAAIRDGHPAVSAFSPHRNLAPPRPGQSCARS